MTMTKPAIAVTALFLFSFATGCQSSGSRFAWWKPAWMQGTTADESSAVARSAPELPSDQFAQGKESGAPLADANTDAKEIDVKPELSPETVAAAPAANYSSVFPSSPPAYKPPTSSALPATLPTGTAGQPVSSVAVAPQAKPYSPISPVESPTPGVESPKTEAPSVAVAPVAASTDRYSAVATDRYASPPSDRYTAPAGDRYSSPAGGDDSATKGLTPPARQERVAVAPPVPKVTTETAEFDRYSRYSSTPTNPPAASSLPASPAETAAPVTTPIASSVELPTSPEGYRPGGTSSYPTSPASAVNIATRPGNPEATSAPAPSAYGSPSYR